MYLEKLTLVNVGPITNLSIEPSFEQGRPKPLVFVGGNGSGKSIAISFLANFLLQLQQNLFDNTEVEKGKAFKVRSPIYVGPDARYYYGAVSCSGGIGLEEWQLSATKGELQSAGVAPAIPSWNSINQDDTNALIPSAPLGNADASVRRAYEQHCALYFPPNRFEEPAWLNSTSSSFTPSVSATQNFRGITKRQIISTHAFKNVLSWLYEVIVDSHVFEVTSLTFNIPGSVEKHNGFMHQEGPNRTLLNEINKLVGLVFEGKYQGQLGLRFGPKNARYISLAETLNGTTRTVVQHLFSLSTGESLVLSLFATILRDYDLGSNSINALQDVKGIVLIDEIDVHLHLDLQRNVLPRLIKAFPNVQFIITTHSPLFLLGMDDQFGPDGYDIYNLPKGEKIQADQFSEFQKAYEEYKNTLHHQRSMQEMLAELARPCLITEGKTDRAILECAWGKLYGATDAFFTVRSSGEIRGESGSARHVQSTLQYVAALATYPIIGLFDNDREGNAQFGGLKSPAFTSISPDLKKNGLITALLLPPPPTREKFVNGIKGSYCFLEIEHYFSDEILQSQDKKGPEVIADTGVFEIQGDKNAFAEFVSSLDATEFIHFHSLFCRIADMLEQPHPVLLAS